MKPRPPAPDGPYLIVGLARSGIAAALALRARGAEVVGVDTGAPPGAAALGDAGVEVHLAQDGLGLLDRVRTVIKSPGVPGQAPVVRGALARGLTVIGELELAWRLLPNEFIAVTGTNGKTTTVELIDHIHRQAGLPAAAAGNLGMAASALVGQVDRRATIICEVSSFQLEDTIAFAPEAAVLLNLAPDHLDRHESFKAYVAAKLAIFARQQEDDLAVLPLELEIPACAGPLGGAARRISFALGYAPEAAMHAGEGSLCWRGRELLATSQLGMRGAHNVQNAMAAALVCLERGVPQEAVSGALRSFRGVTHRLEEVGTFGGVLYVNDSKATNVASTLVALEALAGEGPIHLILGGQAKGQDFRALLGPSLARCRALYLIGEDAPAIADALQQAEAPARRCGELEQALEQASSAARPGEVVLLSPACASFDQFENYEARGERFKELVARIPAPRPAREGFPRRVSK